MYRAAETRTRDYSAWVDIVVGGLRAELGGYVTQSGSGWTFGKGRFYYYDTSDHPGHISFIVSLPRAQGHPARSVGPYRWRAFQPRRVVGDLVAVYREMLQQQSPRHHATITGAKRIEV
jgi:hypothetical protein